MQAFLVCYICGTHTHKYTYIQAENITHLQPQPVHTNTLSQAA